MMTGAKQMLVAAVAFALLSSTAGCRDEEQNRPIVKQKGVYEGPADDEIPEERLQDLRSRAAGQKF